MRSSKLTIGSSDHTFEAVVKKVGAYNEASMKARRPERLEVRPDCLAECPRGPLSALKRT